MKNGHFPQEAAANVSSRQRGSGGAGCRLRRPYRVLSCQCEPARRAGRVQIVLAGFEPAAWSVSLVYVA
jgi:hypothetical protein